MDNDLPILRDIPDARIDDLLMAIRSITDVLEAVYPRVRSFVSYDDQRAIESRLKLLRSVVMRYGR